MDVQQVLAHALSFAVGDALVYRHNIAEEVWWVRRGSLYLSTDGQWVPVDEMNLDTPGPLQRFVFPDLYAALNAAAGLQP